MFLPPKEVRVGTLPIRRGRLRRVDGKKRAILLRINFRGIADPHLMDGFRGKAGQVLKEGGTLAGGERKGVGKHPWIRISGAGGLFLKIELRFLWSKRKGGDEMGKEEQKHTLVRILRVPCGTARAISHPERCPRESFFS